MTRLTPLKDGLKPLHLESYMGEKGPRKRRVVKKHLISERTWVEDVSGQWAHLCEDVTRSGVVFAARQPRSELTHR